MSNLIKVCLHAWQEVMTPWQVRVLYLILNL